MGLMIHSLEGIPEEHQRDYYIYLLDFGWDEPLSDALRKNFKNMALIASQQKNAVVIMHPDSGVHFSDEVLSWHSINGDETEKNELLPAILVTNRHPAEFRRRGISSEDGTAEDNLKLILFPLKKYCKTTTEVIDLIQKIFLKIKEGQDLDDFAITRQKSKGFGRALADSIILEPNIAGVGFNFNNLINYFRRDQ